MNLNSPILEIKDLKVSINENEILKSLNLKVDKGEIHAIMGPNGSGKSTFSKVIAGHPAYSVLNGDIFCFNDSSFFRFINSLVLELFVIEHLWLMKEFC